MLKNQVGFACIRCNLCFLTDIEESKNLTHLLFREEADELCRTLEENEDQTRTASEMADVLYHAMVLLAVKGVKVEEVLEVLRLRFAQSGVEEKKSRKS